MSKSADIIIIGLGPGGMEAASRAVAAGLDTVIIERAEAGGTCLNRGCIPTKALCRSAEMERLVPGSSGGFAAAVARKDMVVEALRANVEASLSRATLVRGDARFNGRPGEVEAAGEVYTAPKIIVATGSAPARLPIPGAELAIDSDSILSMTRLPESVCIIGGGVIGMEIACILHSFGVKVTVLEFCREILPGFDRDIAKRLRTALTRDGIEIITSAEATSIEPGKRVAYMVKGKPGVVEAGEVLMAVGRRPVVPRGLEAELTPKGALVTDGNFMTSVPGVYAIGDVNGRLMLAHVASAQAAKVAGADINLAVVPAAAFTTPECAMVGLTDEQCKDRGIKAKSSKALFRANGKAMAMGETEGLVKLIVDPDTRMLLGAHIMGPHASDLIQELALAMSANLPVDAVARTIHAHPTLGEAVHAAAAAFGE